MIASVKKLEDVGVFKDFKIRRTGSIVKDGMLSEEQGAERLGISIEQLVELVKELHGLN